MDLVAPYSFIPIYKGLVASNELKVIKNKKGDGTKNAPSPVVWELLIEARTFFEKGSAL
ncbi:MAG: hypothetical protein ACYDEC_17840 [Bacteroidia bacterium]